MPGGITLVSNGGSASTNTGASWSTWGWNLVTGGGGMLSSIAEVVGNIWSGVGAVLKIKEGWDEGSKMKMATGTVMLLLSAVAFVPEEYMNVVGGAVGGFGSIAEFLEWAMFAQSDTAKKTIGYIAPMVPVAFAAALKKLASDDLAVNDDGVGALFAVLTAVGNAYEKYPQTYLSKLAEANPGLAKAIPIWGVWRDSGAMTQFITTYGPYCKDYVANTANFALKQAGLGYAQVVGGQAVITGPAQTKGKKPFKSKPKRRRRR